MINFYVSHCVKSVRIWSYSGPHSAFSRTLNEFGEIFGISPYSVQMRENTDQNNFEYVYFLRKGSNTRKGKKMQALRQGYTVKLFIQSIS